MASQRFPPCPPQLKTVQHYLKLATDYESREIAISYWARLYSLQTALQIDKKSPEARSLLTSLMDWLEKFKKDHANNEAITNDVAGQAVIENEAHKLFTFADGQDRKGKYDKNVVKTFYTAGILFDVIEVFGELNEDTSAQRKYAKWKATYIHNCLKNGEIPVPGPIGGDNDNEAIFSSESSDATHTYSSEHPTPIIFPTPPTATDLQPIVSNTPSQVPINAAIPQDDTTASSYGSTGFTPDPESFSKAQKFCKFAISSIDYEDSTTAISYLIKALNLLRTGKE